MPDNFPTQGEAELSIAPAFKRSAPDRQAEHRAEAELSIAPAFKGSKAGRKSFNSAVLTSTHTEISVSERQELIHISNDINARTASKEEIEKAQGALHTHGYDVGNFGPKHDGVDGLAGKLTKGALKQALKQEP